MVRTAADRWKRVKRAPLDLLKAAAAQPFDDNSLLGQAAVFRAKRAKRHKPSPTTKKAVLKDQPPGRLLPFKDGTSVSVVKRKLSVGNAPEAGAPEVEALVREPMGREGSLESDWNLRRIGALLAKSEAMDDEYAVARRKIFNPLPTTKDKASKAHTKGLRTSGLVTRSVVALDHLGDASALRTEGLIRLEGPIVTKKRKPPVPRLHLDRVERDPLEGFMPGHRIGANRERVDLLREPIRDRDKDWRALSWRDHLVLKNGDGVDRYESKKRGFVRDTFWGGDRTRFVPELRRAASTHIIEARGAIISRTRGRLSVIGIGFAGTVFEKLHEEDPSTRMIKIQFQSPQNSISWYQMDRRGLLHIFSERADRGELLVPGNRPKLINALLEHSYFVYALTECWWDGQAPSGWGTSAPFGEHNDLEKECASLKGTRTTYYTHLEHWEAEPGLIKRKGPPLPDEFRVYRETKAKKRFKARLALLRAMSPAKDATALFEAPSPSRPASSTTRPPSAGPPSRPPSAPAPTPAPAAAPAPARSRPSAADARPSSRQQKKPEKWPGAYTVRLCMALRVGPVKRVHLDQVRHIERAMKKDREQAIAAYKAAKWHLTPKRYRGCVVACGAYVKGESCAVRVYDAPALLNKICTVKVTHIRTGLEYECRLPYTDLAKWTCTDEPMDEDDVEGRKRLARKIPSLLSFCSENDLARKAHAESVRRCHARGVPGPQAPLLEQGPSLEVLKIGPRSVPLDADYLTGENVLEKHAQRKYTKPLYLQSGIAGDCVFKQKGYGPGFANALASPLKTPSSPTERGSYELIKRRPPARCVEKELLARGASVVEGRRCRFECLRTLSEDYELKLFFDVTEQYTLPLRRNEVTRYGKASASSKFVHVKREEAVLDARHAAIVAERACLDAHDDEDASRANAAAGMAMSVRDRFKKKRKKKKGRGPPKVGMSRDEKRACMAVAVASRHMEFRGPATFAEFVRDLVEQCVDDALQEPERVVKDVLRQAVRTVACSQSADDAEAYVRHSCAACWSDLCKRLLSDVRMVPDLPVLQERERAVAYSGEDAFEAACVALCAAPASKLGAKPPMSEKFVETTKLEPWLRRELSIPDKIRKRLLDKNQSQAFLAKVAVAGKKHRDHTGNVFDAKNARVLLKQILKMKYKEKPRLRLESRLWRGMRRIKCFGLPGVGTHLSVCVTVNWFDDSVLVQLEQLETCELIPLEVDEEYLTDLADQIDNLEMVDGRYDLTINVFLRALVIKEAPKGSPTRYIAELDETSGWASSRPTTRATDLMVDDLAEFAFVDDDDDSPLTTDQDYGVELGSRAEGYYEAARARV